MADGIKNSDAFCICLTRKYMHKLAQHCNTDNCVRELHFAFSIGKRIVPLILEPELLNMDSWPQSILCTQLKTMLFMDASGNDMTEIAHRLNTMLYDLNLRPRYALGTRPRLRCNPNDTVIFI